jgi:hypothetical protein
VEGIEGAGSVLVVAAGGNDQGHGGVTRREGTRGDQGGRLGHETKAEGTTGNRGTGHRRPIAP